MEEVNNEMDSQENPRLLRNPKIQYVIHYESAAEPPPEPDAPQPHLLTHIRYNLYSHLRLDLQSILFPSGFTIKILYAFLSSSMRATCRSHLIVLYLITLPVVDNFRILSVSYKLIMLIKICVWWRRYVYLLLFCLTTPY